MPYLCKLLTLASKPQTYFRQTLHQIRMYFYSAKIICTTNYLESVVINQPLYVGKKSVGYDFQTNYSNGVDNIFVKNSHTVPLR